MRMRNHATHSLNSSTDRDHDHNFAPDFAWSVAGGAVVVALTALLYALVVTWGGFQLDATHAGAEAVPFSAHLKEITGLALGGALVVLVIRGIRMQTGETP
jgi:hypothetical protein